MSKQAIGIIGGGNMGEALVKGLYKSHRVMVVEANAARAGYLKKKYRVAVLSMPETVKASGIIVLAVKPQDMGDVLAQIKEIGSGNKLFISIAAGLTTKFFETHLGNKARVVRSMPNMPALIGEGITGVCAGHYAKPVDLKLAQGILSAVGEVVTVKESMIDAVTAVSGSGPAYVFLFVEQWMVAARKLGFNEADAQKLVYQTLTGSAHLLNQSAFSAAELRAKVTSKGGTTQAAMDVFFARKIDKVINEALSAAQKRARQLAK